ncbi:MAG: manganese efflux pump MntP family protein [Labilithrix sp.]|nr:manganese efflux pump MntP family protein [Labilithrix sp.]
MAFVEIVVLAVALAMDAMAVAGARGLAAERIRAREALLVAAFFGGAQAAMPALGWLAGASLSSWIGGWGHWLTFVVLTGLGIKMIHEAVTASDDPEAPRDASRPFGWKALAALAVATSIDALGAGITLAVRGANASSPARRSGVTAALSFAGVYVGHRFGARVGKRLDVLGGVVLVALGVRRSSSVPRR